MQKVLYSVSIVQTEDRKLLRMIGCDDSFREKGDSLKSAGESIADIMIAVLTLDNLIERVDKPDIKIIKNNLVKPH